MQAWIGLALALVSALAVNWAYTREHDAAARLPPLSPRNPVHSAAVALIGAHGRISRAAVLGLAAGLLFAAGDISTKLVVQGGAWLIALVALVACYATGTSVLQSAFQHGAALTAAGIATLTTNAVPIAAGIVLFDEPLPAGAGRVLRIVAFGLLVVGAAFLADPRARPPDGGGAVGGRVPGASG